jgi:hypothetical protein
MGLQSALQSTFAQASPQSIAVVPPHPETSITIPSPEQEGMIYVPPMYTKPRPIIPRYRIISGLLSFLIVCLVACVGAGYYAKTSGALNAVGSFVSGGNLPRNIQATNSTLPDPPNKIDRGPAYNTIPSATTTAHLIQGTYIAAQTDKVFRPGEQFALTYSVNPPNQGKVVIKWYTNGVLFYTSTSNTITAGGSTSGVVQITYPQQTEGMVELYWNDQLAQRLYFVVRN